MAAAFSIAYTATPLGATTKLIVEATRQFPPGVSFVPRSEYRQLLISAAAAVSPAVALTQYNAKFGTLVSGKRIFIRLTAITADGNRSAPLSTSVLVA